MHTRPRNVSTQHDTNLLVRVRVEVRAVGLDDRDLAVGEGDEALRVAGERRRLRRDVAAVAPVPGEKRG